MKKVLSRNEGNERNYYVLLINLMLAYLVTFGLLMILAFLTYKMQLSEKTVSLCITVVYAAVTFLAGLLTGKKLKTKKFLWGLITGLGYFAVLVIISLIGGRASAINSRDVITTLLLCAGGGMLGGMLG